MKEYVNVKIRWFMHESKARQRHIDKNVKYCPIIDFQDTLYNDIDWSAEIYSEEANDDGISNARLSFLSKDAPFELLQEGAEFTLREGCKIVAKGIISARK